jgi:hypothetical protein
MAEAAARSRALHEQRSGLEREHDPSPPNPSPSSTTSQIDGERPLPTAAERRRRFEEVKQRLENDETASAVSPGGVHSDELRMGPIFASLLVGQGRRFHLYDRWWRLLAGKALWSSSNPAVVEVTGDEGDVIAKAEGTATIRARLGTFEAEAEVKVYPGTSLPEGTPIWTQPLPGEGPVKLTPAIPH